MNKADEEILQIIKKTFRKIPKNKFIDPDEVLNVKIIKEIFFLSLLSIAVWATILVSGNEIEAWFRVVIATLISVFFGFLFIHINNKSENQSVIMFALTWISMTLGLYF